MTSLEKIFFFSLLLTGLIFFATKTDISVSIIGVLFLLASFISALSVNAQSITLASLPFLFISGIIFFLGIIRGNGGISENLFLDLILAIFLAVFGISARFSSLYKNLPNVKQEEHSKFTKKYVAVRNLILSLLFLTAFVWYANAFMVYSVLALPFYLALITFFLITLCLTSFLLKIYQTSSLGRKLPFSISFYSWITGFVISEIAWIAGFWPFTYLTAALIITIIYYAIAMILKEYLFSDNFKRNFALREILFAAATIAIIFYFIKWLPL